jgi:hypothetical protein
MIRVPIDLGPVMRMHQILNRQSMQILVSAQDANDIPTQPIDINPSTLNPWLPFPRQKLFKRIIIQHIMPHILLRKIYNGNLADAMKLDRQ